MTVLEREGEALAQGAFAALRDSKCPRDGRKHEICIAEWGQVNEQPAVIEIGNHRVGNGQCQARLADATGSGQRQQWDGLFEEERTARHFAPLPGR